MDKTTGVQYDCQVSGNGLVCYGYHLLSNDYFYAFNDDGQQSYSFLLGSLPNKLNA